MLRLSVAFAAVIVRAANVSSMETDIKIVIKAHREALLGDKAHR
jgi:hypothetical protein